MLNATRFKLKCKLEDFSVTEVSLSPVLTEKKLANYTYIWLRKAGINTFDAIENIASYFSIDLNDINVQGLKDEDAITHQMISLRKIVDAEAIANFNQVYITSPLLSIERIIGYGVQPVQEKFLHGNLFDVVVRNLDDVTAKRVEHYGTQQRFFTLVNYYDDQRFGLPGHPALAHLIGKAIVENDWGNAYQFLKASGNAIPAELATRSCTSEEISRYMRSLNIKRLSFFVSAYNSYLWNIQASRTFSEMNFGKELHLLQNVSEVNLPLCDNFNLSNTVCLETAFDLTGYPLRINSRAKVRAFSVSTAIHIGHVIDDEMHPYRKKLQISFFLPSGCYATMLLKQLLVRA